MESFRVTFYVDFAGDGTHCQSLRHGEDTRGGERVEDTRPISE